MDNDDFELFEDDDSITNQVKSYDTLNKKNENITMYSLEERRSLSDDISDIHKTWEQNKDLISIFDMQIIDTPQDFQPQPLPVAEQETKIPKLSLKKIIVFLTCVVVIYLIVSLIIGLLH